jgi:hypothetical protein
MLQFTVEIKYLKGTPLALAKFKDEADARAFIAAKIEKDAALRTTVTYILLEMGEEVESFDSSGKAAEMTAGGTAGGGQAKSSTQNFRPSPLQTTLRPSGVPPSSFKSDDDKDKK